MFEDLLIHSEAAIRRALGVEGREVRDWPRSWSAPECLRQPDKLLLQGAIRAARSLRPPPPILQKIHGDMQTNKNEWGIYFLQAILQDEGARAQVQAHPIARRLQELLPG